MSVIRVFHQTAGYKADEIQKLYDEGDIENYTIKVHALKSSARIIGAAALSDLAKELELAGKAGDTDRIKADTGNLLEQYRTLHSKLKHLDADDGQLKDITPDMRAEAFQTMGEIAQSMDYGMMEDIIKDLREYRLSEEDRSALNRIEDMLMQLDWDGIVRIVKGVV